MKKIFVLLFIILLAGGCERSLDSGDLGFDPPDELPVPIALKIYHLADGIELNWQISDSSAVDYFNIYYSDAEENEFVLLDSTSLFSKTILTLNTGQVYYFKVAAADANDVEGSYSTTVSSQIGVTSIVINNNDIYTNSTVVAVQYVYPVTPLLVKISEDAGLNNAVWQSFSQPGSFELLDGDGVKFIYALFRFSDGSESSLAVSDSIILDTRAFIDSSYFIADSSVLLAGDTVYFYLNASETGGAAFISFTGLGLDLYDDGTSGDTMADDGIYSRRYIIPINFEIEDGVVTGSFTDAAGNVADGVVSDDRINIAIAPDPLSLQTIAESSSQIRLSWSQVNTGSSEFSSYRIYRGTVTGITESSELVANITSQSTLGYTDNSLNDNQQYIYRVYAYSSAGLVTQSEESSATTMVNLPPTPVTLAVGLIVDELTINISWTENSDPDFESYQIYRGSAVDVTDLTGQRLTAINDQSQTSYTDVRFDALDTYYYVLYVYDKQGLKSPKSNVESTP